MIDQKCYYLGSQNLYVVNLAEWGLIIDSSAACAKMKTEYWDVLWKHSAWSRCKTEDILTELHKEGEKTDAMKEDSAYLLEDGQKQVHLVVGGGRPDPSFLCTQEPDREHLDIRHRFGSESWLLSRERKGQQLPTQHLEDLEQRFNVLEQRIRPFEQKQRFSP